MFAVSRLSRLSLPLASRRLLSSGARGSFPYARAISMGIGATMFMAYVANTSVFALTRGVSAEDIARHNSSGQGVWLAVNGQVYDFTDYVSEHPVNSQKLLQLTGKGSVVSADMSQQKSLPKEALCAGKHLGPLVQL